MDVNYTIYFPFLEQYVSLYPSSTRASQETSDTPAAELALHAERPPMWATVEEAMEQGERALIRLQNRRPESRGESKGRIRKAPAETALATGESKPEPTKPKKKEAADGKGKKKAKEPPRAQSDNDESDSESDGGFFEMA